jgi:hypothetical protein
MTKREICPCGCENPKGNCDCCMAYLRRRVAEITDQELLEYGYTRAAVEGWEWEQ